jgi:hypothetical protein
MSQRKLCFTEHELKTINFNSNICMGTRQKNHFMYCVICYDKLSNDKKSEVQAWQLLRTKKRLTFIGKIWKYTLENPTKV